MLTRLLPIFKRFNSSVVRDVEFTLKPSDGGYDTSDFKSPVNHEFNGVPLGFGFVVKSPDLPNYRGTPVDGVVLVGGANVAGRGVVPLGLAVGVDTGMPIDNRVDPQGSLPAGSMIMRMAPTHHGLEGSPYGIIALASSIKAATDSTAGLAASAIFQRIAENKLVFNPTGTTGSVQLIGPYLTIPESAKYNFTDIAQPALTAHTFKFTSMISLTGVTVVRVLFTDNAEHRWTVMMSPADATGGFTLPKPPVGSGLPDRTYATNNTTGARSGMLVQTLKLNSNPGAGGTDLSYANLVELNSTNADRLIDFTSAFTLLDYGAPAISFLTPAKAGDTVAKNTDVKVKVARFKIGTTAMEDGVVRLEIVGGSAQCQPAVAPVGNMDASQGKGEILIKLPTDCTGMGLTLRARLYNTANALPIDPHRLARDPPANIQ